MPESLLAGLPPPASPGLAEALNYHSQSRWGYFSILSNKPGKPGKLRQDTYPLNLLSPVLSILDPGLDTYLSQNEFRRRNRRVVNLKNICLCFVDLDFSKTKTPWSPDRHDEFLDFLFEWHRWSGPFPSAIIASGRGYHLKWFLERPIPSEALPRWNAVQNALTGKYKELGADPAAKDASRVLRVIGTTNSKCGKLATMIYPRGDRVPEVYDFEHMALELLPLQRSEIEAARAERKREGTEKRVTPASSFNLTSLNWGRMGDLRKLALSRKIANGALDGQRMLFLFWEVNFLMLSKAALPRLMYAEAAILARELDTSWSYRSQELGTVYSKAVSYSQGKSVEFKGRLYPALYTPKNETLINLFEITSDEMAQMRTIIDTGEERRRHRLREESRRREAGAAVRADYLDGARMDPEAKAQAHRERNRVREEALRREAGAAEREAYLAERSQEAEERKSKARTLRERGMSYRAIADEMGVSVASVHNYLSLRD